LKEKKSPKKPKYEWIGFANGKLPFYPICVPDNKNPSSDQLISRKLDALKSDSKSLVGPFVRHTTNGLENDGGNLQVWNFLV